MFLAVCNELRYISWGPREFSIASYLLGVVWVFEEILLVLLPFVDLVEVYPSGSMGCFSCRDSTLSWSVERNGAVPLEGVVSL